jgi:hypothetical protein
VAGSTDILRRAPVCELIEAAESQGILQHSDEVQQYLEHQQQAKALTPLQRLNDKEADDNWGKYEYQPPPEERFSPSLRGARPSIADGDHQQPNSAQQAQLWQVAPAARAGPRADA